MKRHSSCGSYEQHQTEIPLANVKCTLVGTGTTYNCFNLPYTHHVSCLSLRNSFKWGLTKLVVVLLNLRKVMTKKIY